MACLYVSTKLHDTLKKPRDILMAAYYIRLPELAAKSKTGTDVDIDQAVRAVTRLCLPFIHLFSSRLSLLFSTQTLEADRHRLISIERLILETICFNFRVRLPFSYVIKMCREFHGKLIAHCSWVVDNTSAASKELAKLAWRLSIDRYVVLFMCLFIPF
jgi:CTD kinase subunit beta